MPGAFLDVWGERDSWKEMVVVEGVAEVVGGWDDVESCLSSELRLSPQLIPRDLKAGDERAAYVMRFSKSLLVRVTSHDAGCL